eukprot:2122017-Alexandrium_andersonii.AAC.1
MRPNIRRRLARPRVSPFRASGFLEACGNSSLAGRSPKLSSVLSSGPAGFAEACGNSTRAGR